MASHSKIKLVQPGWDTFTGNFATVEFVDGVSVDYASKVDIDRISAQILTVLIDDEGNDQGQAGSAARYVNSQTIPLDEVEPLPVMTDEQREAEQKVALEKALKARSVKIHTREQLEAIASTEGLRGVRAVGDTWGVKERAISKLIELILKAQSEFTAEKDKSEAAANAAREAAEKEALEVQAQKERELDAQARNLTHEAEAKKTADAQKAHDASQPDVPGTVPVTSVPANEWNNNLQTDQAPAETQKD